MIELSIFLKKYLGFLASAAKPIGFLFLIVFLLGNLLYFIDSGVPQSTYFESLAISFSTFLSLGNPDHDKFNGVLRLVELSIDILSLIFFAILAAAAIKSLERGNKKG